MVQLVIHEELQNIFRPVFIDGSFACQYGRGPIRAALKVQHDMRVARMKWGDDVAVIKIDARKFFYSIDRDLLKKILAKRFKKLKKKHPDMYGDLLRFYRLLCKVIDSSPEGERGIPLGNVSSQDFANIYLNELDQFCVRFLGAKLYTRYMDDVVIVAPSKEIAREWLAKIKEFLQVRLHLDTNKKTKVFYMRQGVNAYGFKIKATHLMIRTESKTAGEAAHQSDGSEDEGRQDHAGGGRPGGQLVDRVRPVGQCLQSREEDIRALPLHQNGRSDPLWRNISEPSSSADSTTTAQSSSGPQGRGGLTRRRTARPAATATSPQMSGSMANYTFGDTPSADANKLQWVKIKDGDKTLLICDRVILVSVSWDDLNGQGYVTGKTITIDGAKYKCRLLTGGSNRRNRRLVCRRNTYQ